MAKEYRRSIRIHGQEVKSPRFKRASDADAWYEAQLRNKQLARDGVEIIADSKTTLKDYFDLIWLEARKKNYPEATWSADEQRFNKYLAKPLGRMKVSKISQLRVRNAIRDVVEVHKMNTKTRDRVRSLASKIFNDAMNEKSPLRADNPAMGISFTDARVGTKTPNHIKRMQDILKFIKCAKELSTNHFIYACIALMAAPRKSEIIPLRWNDFDPEECDLTIDEKFEQASMTILDGTKSGSDESRVIAISDDLVRVLSEHKKNAIYNGEDDFILCTADGQCIKPRYLHTLHEEIRTLAGVNVTPHGLRHTYGRQFVVNGGEMKALQTIMGHSNMSVTELYSKLAGKEVKKHRNTVSFKTGGDRTES